MINSLPSESSNLSSSGCFDRYPDTVAPTALARDLKPLVSDSYQQNAVNNGTYPRINGTALGQLSTHKRNRFELNPRINGTAFTHKRNRLCGSILRGYWATAIPPVSTSITTIPILRTNTRIGCAKMRINNHD